MYPYLAYCNSIWGCTKNNLLQRLIILQKRVVRIVTRSSYCSHGNPLFARLRLLRVSDIYKLQVVLFIFKFKYSLLPASCMNYLFVNSAPAYATRRNTYLVELSFRTNIRERSISVSGPRIWNRLSPDLQDSLSLGFLKQDFLNYMISLYV